MALGDLDAALGDGDRRRRRRGRSRGEHDDEFPLVVWQTGSGTQTNMNMNEVLANRANELLGGERGAKQPVHPNDHVNHRPILERQLSDRDAHRRGDARSTTALLPALQQLARRARGEGAANSPPSSRSAAPISRTRRRVHARPGIRRLCAGRSSSASRASSACLPRLYPLAQGGTAVGTGLNAPPGFAERFAAELDRADRASRSSRAATSSRRWQRMTRSSSCRAR